MALASYADAMGRHVRPAEQADHRRCGRHVPAVARVLRALQLLRSSHVLRPVRRGVRTSTPTRRAHHGSPRVAGRRDAASVRGDRREAARDASRTNRLGERDPLRRLLHEQRVQREGRRAHARSERCYVSGHPDDSGHLGRRGAVSCTTANGATGRPLTSHNYWGPAYTDAECLEVARRYKLANAEVVDDPSDERPRTWPRADHRVVPGTHGVRAARAGEPLDPARPAAQRRTRRLEPGREVPRGVPSVRTRDPRGARERLLRVSR